jgi:NAD(P)H-dependent FMN reductase
MMLKILVIVGSTRPGRKSRTVADWFMKNAEGRNPDLHFELVDLAEVNLPFMDEPKPPMADDYQQAHTKKWASVIGPADGYVLITPEYNHSYPAVLKNAVDFLYEEWRHKPVGFVSYGVAEGVRAVEHLKTVMIQVDAAPLNAQVSFNVMSQFAEDGSVTPTDKNEYQLNNLLTELAWWGETLKLGRVKRASYKTA